MSTWRPSRTKSPALALMLRELSQCREVQMLNLALLGNLCCFVLLEKKFLMPSDPPLSHHLYTNDYMRAASLAAQCLGDNAWSVASYWGWR